MKNELSYSVTFKAATAFALLCPIGQQQQILQVSSILVDIGPKCSCSTKKEGELSEEYNNRRDALVAAVDFTHWIFWFL